MLPCLHAPHVTVHQGLLRPPPWLRSRSPGPQTRSKCCSQLQSAPGPPAHMASAPSCVHSTHSGSLAPAGWSSAQHIMCWCGWEKTPPLLSAPEWVPTAYRRRLCGRSWGSPQSRHTPAPNLPCSDQHPGVWTGPLSLGGLPPRTLIEVLPQPVTTHPVSCWSLLLPDPNLGGGHSRAVSPGPGAGVRGSPGQPICGLLASGGTGLTVCCLATLLGYSPEPPQPDVSSEWTPAPPAIHSACQNEEGPRENKLVWARRPD